jgi:hypothetical protein
LRAPYFFSPTIRSCGMQSQAPGKTHTLAYPPSWDVSESSWLSPSFAQDSEHWID